VRQSERADIATRPVVYQIPGMDAVSVRREVEFGAGNAGPLTMDVYYPPESMNSARLPAVVFVSGYPDQGVQAVIGCRSKEMECYISWGRLAAASGLVAITYTSLEPVVDLQTLFRYLRDDAAALGIDESRIGLWACSGNVPMALSLLMREDAKNLK